MRILLWHATYGTYQQEAHKPRVSVEHYSNSSPRFESLCLYLQGATRVWKPKTCWLRGAFYTVLLSLLLVLTMMGGHLYAQTPPLGNEPAPTPAPTGLLETLPSPQEQLLAPVPQQFNWLERAVPSNPLLESLLSLGAPGGLTVSTSLTEDGSDNFAHAPGSHRVDFRTGVVLGTVYRLDDGQNFVSLANTISAFYQARTATSQIGFANLVLHGGYQLPPLSFGLTDSFVRDDNTAQLQAQDTSLALLRTRQKFIRNILTPQVHYDILPTTAATLSYTNTLVVDESGTQGTTTSHAVSPGIQHQFSPNLTGHIRYTFTTSNGSGLSSGTGISGNRSHRIATDLGYQFDTETSAILSAFGTLVDRSTSTSTTGGQNSRTYGTSIGVRRVLFSTVSVFGSVGPTVFKRQGEREKLRANWQLSLDGPIPLFATPSLTLTLTTNQSVVDTVGEVNNVGLVLRQVVAARLTYTPSAVWTAALLATYSRNELLENSDTIGGEQGRIDNLSSAGVTASYALTRVIALTGTYLYQRRDSDRAGNNFDENRVTIAVTGRFPVF